MSSNRRTTLDRRNFLRSTGGAVAGAALLGSAAGQAQQAAPAAKPEPIYKASAFRPLTDNEKVERIAANSYPLRWLFKVHDQYNSITTDQAEVKRMKAKYGEIDALTYPEFTKKTFPGVTKMDLWSSLFGNPADDSQYVTSSLNLPDDGTRKRVEFDPSAPSSQRWLNQLAARLKDTGTHVHHISNNAPRDICDLDDTKRKAGIEVAKKWLDGAAVIGAKSMRVNTGGPRISPIAEVDPSSYPKNPKIEQYLAQAIDSFGQMAEYGAKVGVKVTIENHWGLSANPINMRIIVEEVNNRFCELSPDFGNWEHKYLVQHALNDVAPYAHTTVHAKYWNRWQDPDVQRGVRIMLNNNYDGVFALEYEEGPWDGVQGALYLYHEVMAAL